MDDASGGRLSQLSRSVAGHVVLVTGAGSGIGRATAHLFADEGARVAVTDVDGDAAAAVAAEVEGAGGAARAWGLDVTDRPEVRRVVDEVVAWGPGLDVLVNNAGAAMGAPIGHDAFVDTWDRALDLMATAQTTAIRAALPHLRASSAGRIVNVSSTEGVGGSAGMAAYTAAKHAVVGLTRALAVELGDDGITVNAVCPGPVDTALTSSIPDDAKVKFARRRVPLRRYAQPEEIAHGILHLALPASGYITGHALLVDGGMTIKNN
ncbi:MAG: SDR family oxidoreductase [Acidimicrobiales bacterium]|jgi:3-oxoacyl-[acyl-carrier protein] reductase|nr:SDR family oxidoreductase [Acidimicrobiales bacterium]